ncbi:hypothetical protein LINPERHAP1_LOCUS27128 [Linum perenne]
MANSSSAGGCLCNKTSKVLRIVYPGGRIELHDTPILAGAIMAKNPKFAVAHPEVFRQPLAAVVSPETTLMLGQKFYVVPTNTIRKLQRKYVKRNGGSSGASIEGHRNNFYNNRTSKVTVIKGRVGCLSSVIKSICGDRVKKDKYCVNDDHRMVRIVIYNGDGSSSGGGGSSSGGSFGSPDGSWAGGGRGSSPKKGLHMDYWTPNLESITEEN